MYSTSGRAHSTTLAVRAAAPESKPLPSITEGFDSSPSSSYSLIGLPEGTSVAVPPSARNVAVATRERTTLDRPPAVVRRAHERPREAERPAQRPGQDAEPDDAGRLEALKHLEHERVPQDRALERVAVHEQRRVECVERCHAVLGEAAGGVESHLRLAGLHVADRVFLPLDLLVAPVRLDLDPQRPVRAPGDLVGIEVRKRLLWIPSAIRSTTGPSAPRRRPCCWCCRHSRTRRAPDLRS